MPFNLALADLVSPYLTKGENLGSWHAALSVIRVTEFEIASDVFGVVIRGRCQFNGRASIDIGSGSLVVNAAVDEAEPPFDPNRKAPVFDVRETTLDFELFVPRDGSQIIANGVASIAAPGFQPTMDVLNVWDTLPVDPAPSDFPASGFNLDLVLNAPTIRPPFLHPAKMTDDGLLVPDTDFKEVALKLPKLRFRMAHGNAAGSRLSFELVSVGVAGLDDPGDIGVAELISMEPPYAFVGKKDERTYGFGFRSAVLDVSEGTTPPAVIEKFGFGDDWFGLYLPEVRFFMAPEGVKDLAFAAGIKDLLIGFGEHAGISGDFEIAVINQGDGELKVSARFFDENGRAYGIRPGADSEHATAFVPAQTRMVVDIEGGRAPYDSQVSVNGGAQQSGRIFNINLTTQSPQTISIEVQDTSTTPIEKTLEIEVTRGTAQTTLVIPGDPVTTVGAVTVAPSPGEIIKDSETTDQVIVTTETSDASLRWSIDGGVETPPQSKLTVVLAANETKVVTARRPGTTVPTALDCYFFFEEPPPSEGNEAAGLRAYAQTAGNVSTARAVDESRTREAGDQDPFVAYREYLRLVPDGASIIVRGEASYEGDDEKRNFNYHLSRRRAIAVAERLKAEFAGKHFVVDFDPKPASPSTYSGLVGWTANWKTHGDPGRRDWWKATIVLPAGVGQPEHTATATVTRPSTTAPGPGTIKVIDPPAPAQPRAPDWFRSIKIRARFIRDNPVAGELEAEVDFQTAAEEKMQQSGAPTAGSPDIHTLENGAPIGADNPADGITKLHVLIQKDSALDRLTTLISIGANSADKDGLLAAGWLPGETMPADKDFALTVLGSYISFWPLLVSVSDGNDGSVEDAALVGAALLTPAVIAALPFFRVERVILFGGEYLLRDRGSEREAFLLFDVEVDWSVDISIGSTTIIEVEREHPLAIRYKAIGLRFGNRGEDGSPQFSLRPVFDSSRGYTIDIAKNGSLKVADPFDKILKVLAARISRTNPFLFEIDVGMGVDLGVVTVDRARVRVQLDPPGPPELTALGLSVDISGALVGSGYAEINESSIAGQLDLTLRTISLRVSAAVGIANIEDDGQTATAVYVGLSVVLPVGIPLGQSGLGIFGFRGIFGMHYGRNETIGAGTSAPALQWLAASEGQPHLLKAPGSGQDLWIPELDKWSFGLGVLIGTMEGGFVLNLDGTLILELPGPRVLVVMNARILSPPPDLEGMGVSGGILAVIEITPDHILIGILAQYDIGGLISIKVPVDALFSFGDLSNWHVYLGQRTVPIEVKVLDFIKGTGYLMVQGNGLAAYKTLPEVKGIAIGIGAAASFTWGSTDIGLYLRVGGGMDAVIGFDPFILAGLFVVSGELRLFIVSVGAHASLTVIVKETAGGDLDTYIHGEACGSVSFFFFDVSGCVDITISSPEPGPAPMPALVEKLSLKSRSPALAVGTAVDRPVDGSLGDGVLTPSDPDIITVPIDSVPILSMVMPPVSAGTTFQGSTANVNGTSGVAPGEFADRGKEKYQYELSAVTLERIGQAGPALIGSVAPATWWIMKPPTDTNIVAQLVLLTWEATAAPKAIEKNEHLEESITDRWGQVCDDAAPPASVLWTFRYEKLGPSLFGWQLEGIAWPDPPGTQRTAEPDTTLQVTERWRTGDPVIDGKRGIFPAMVVGGQVKCERPDQPDDAIRWDQPILVAGGRGPIRGRPTTAAERMVATRDPVFQLITRGDEKAPYRISEGLYGKVAAYQSLDMPGRDLRTILGDLAKGEGVTLDELGRAVIAPPRSQRTANNDKTCEVRVLQAPMFDDGRILVFGSKGEEQIKQALDQHGVTHGPLDEVVVLHMGAFKDARLLVFVDPTAQRQKRLVVRVLAEDGSEIGRVTPSNADRLPPKTVPGSWMDATGPWSDDVDDLLLWPTSSSPVASYVPLLISVPGSEKARRIEIGVLPADFEHAKEMRPLYYLAAMEALRLSEVTRSEWDEFKIQKDHDVLTNVLGPASTDNALMHPGSLYRVTATWTGTRQSGGSAGDSQEFFFRTDSEAPKHLDPWMLMTTPSDGEASAFGAEPVRLVFNTHDIDRLYAAYGKELRVRFQAASAHHPTPEPTAPHPFPINAVTMQPVKGAMLSPWEETLVEVIGEHGLCIDIDEDRSRHSIVDIPLPLDPYTDYIMDVESVDIGAAESATGVRVYRRHFSTGAFGTFSDFAASLQAVQVSHRFVPLGAMNAIRGFFGGRRPEGSELDEQLRSSAKIEALGAPRMPGVTVFWEQTGTNPPHPAAVLVDASEPMWRSRPHAKKITDATGPTTSERWQMENKDWLQLELGQGSDPVIASDGLIRAPGDQRALIVLAPNSRGQVLRLDLVRVAFTESYLNTPETRFAAVELTFERAPWEE